MNHAAGTIVLGERGKFRALHAACTIRETRISLPGFRGALAHSRDTGKGILQWRAKDRPTAGQLPDGRIAAVAKNPCGILKENLVEL